MPKPKINKYVANNQIDKPGTYKTNNKAIKAIVVPMAIIDSLCFRRSDNKPNKGPPAANPKNTKEVKLAACALVKRYATSKNGLPHSPPNTATGAKAKPL